ncbi:epoxide hydrolase N-terminal domain-containing protein [Streptomyces sp. MS1.HAVA.3]|uniref:Epoxide hydrolase N-terminal domain-containing protein n=1 Tax=Streptomyces caledonius TaxID=3134107 RepID=A0ABU8U4L0_9ACTN
MPTTATATAALDDTSLAASLDGGFTSHHAEVNGTRLHFVDSGADSAAEPLVLLGGWPQTWWQWHKVLPGWPTGTG